MKTYKKGFRFDTENIPQDVKDKEAYLAAAKLAQDPILAPENTILETSDPELIINLSSSKYVLLQRIGYLPEKERNNLINQAQKRRSVFGKLIQLRNKAFGINERPDIDSNPPDTLYSVYRAEIIDLFGRFFTIGEVQDILYKKHGLTISPNTLNGFKLKCSPAINEKQEAFKRDYSDVRLGYKRSRLDELTYLYNHRKNIYQSSQAREDYRLLLQTINQIRQEVEGDILNINGNIIHDIELTINHQLREDMLKESLLLEIVVARLATKNNINPLYYITKLRNSLYAKLNGFNPEITNFQEEIIWPSQQMIGLDNIEKKAEQKMAEDKQLKEQVPFEIINTGNELLKQKLLEKIKEKQKQISLTRFESDAVGEQTNLIV